MTVDLMPLVLRTVVLVTVGLVSACASGPSRQPPPGDSGSAIEAREGDAASGARGGPEASLDERLDGAIRNGWREGHLLVECQRNGRLESVRVFSRGVGIWSEVRQFELSRVELRDLLVALRDGGFLAMKKVFGGRTLVDPERQGFVVVCQVELEVDGVSRSVVQRRRGEQSAALRTLALDLLDACREPGQSGVAADSLLQGLEMLAEGALEPEVWSLLFHRKPDAKAPDPHGWLLRIEGRRLTLQSFSPEVGYGAPRSRRLRGEEMAALLRALVDARPGTLPANLWAETYTDLVVQLLGHRASLQGRPFAGMDRRTHGDAQVRFDRLTALLQALCLEVSRPEDLEGDDAS